MKFIIIFIQIVIFVSCQEVTNNEFKRVPLCPEKTPKNIRDNVIENGDKMRDLMLTAIRKNELELENEGYQGGNSPNASERSHVGSKTPVLGSINMVTDTKHDAGLLSTIYEAYGNHYNLRTGPEDWWYTIIQTVALAIDKNSKNENVRNFFVDHEGKKEIRVKVGPPPLKIESLDYTWLFDQFSNGIKENINVPQYVQQIIPDFSTTTPIHKIVSQITLMSSVQEFFEYTVFTACGIPEIEMKGTQADWEKLGRKIRELRKTLEPIEDVFGYDWNGESWWEGVEDIATKLLDTYNGNPDEDWWSRIITEQKYGSGAPSFNGWFMNNLLNRKGATSISSAPSGLVSIPMNFEDDGIKEKGAVIAGMVGYKHHEGTRPAIEPMHGWTLLLENNSYFRKGLTDWEQTIPQENVESVVA